jgi:hypothetical protein
METNEQRNIERQTTKNRMPEHKKVNIVKIHHIESTKHRIGLNSDRTEHQ